MAALVAVSVVCAGLQMCACVCTGGTQCKSCEPLVVVFYCNLCEGCLQCSTTHLSTLSNTHPPQGIGDSGQGIANAIIFGLFSPKVRRFFFYYLTCCHCCVKRTPFSINMSGSTGKKRSASPEISNHSAELTYDGPLSSSEGTSMAEQESDRRSLLA